MAVRWSGEPLRSVLEKAMRPKGALRSTSLGAGRPSLPKKKPGCGLAESVSPPIEDKASDIALGIEAGAGEHIVKLLADATLVLAVGGAEQLGAALRTLHLRRQARIEEGHVQSENGGRVRADRLEVCSERRHLADFSPVADPLEPAPARDAELIEEPPVAHGHVRHHVGRAVELRVGVAMREGQVAH